MLFTVLWLEISLEINSDDEVKDDRDKEDEGEDEENDYPGKRGIRHDSGDTQDAKDKEGYGHEDPVLRLFLLCVRLVIKKWARHYF